MGFKVEISYLVGELGSFNSQAVNLSLLTSWWTIGPLQSRSTTKERCMWMILDPVCGVGLQLREGIC